MSSSTSSNLGSNLSALKDNDDDKDKKESETIIVDANETIDTKKSTPTTQNDVKKDIVEGELVDDDDDDDSSDDSDTDESQIKDNTIDIKPPPPVIPPGERMEFQAETRQLLDIVTNSLYTDKEVFLRELVSNASDSLEKLRHLQATNQASLQQGGDGDGDLPLEIRIDLDEVTSTITITDTGVGMTRDELISNLGTIARSGSKNFVKQMKESGTGNAFDPSQGIIGKFGVGFYSSFMVGEKVEVRTRSAVDGNEAPKVWMSDGSGSYEISDLPDGFRQNRGSSVIIHMKEDHWDFVSEPRIEGIIKKYSNFVNFPIYLNGKLVNTLKAIWTQEPKDVKEEEYSAFYKYITNAVDDPLDVYHFRADAPIDIKALFFIPSFHAEKHGMERMEPGVSLYSRKIMIEAKSPNILPEWLRFVKGVVDSEDLPLSISREKPQDTALVGKLKKTLTRKIVTHLAKMSVKEKGKYRDEFYKEYSYFLKEGICQDHDSMKQLAKLLLFETSRALEDSTATKNDLVSFDEYIARMRPEQNAIYYLVAPSRAAAVNSPYLESFENAGVEVFLMFSPIDDFVMGNMEDYEGRQLVSVDKSDIDFKELKKNKPEELSKKDSDIYKADRELSSAETLEVCDWFKKELGDKKIASVTATSRLTSSPAIVTDNESSAMRRMMRMIDTTASNDEIELPKQHLEINVKHPIIVGIHAVSKTEPTLAKVLTEQVYDNCLVAAGLLDDSRSMIPRINDILVCVVKGAQERLGPSTDGTSDTAKSKVSEKDAGLSDIKDAEFNEIESSESGDSQSVKTNNSSGNGEKSVGSDDVTVTDAEFNELSKDGKTNDSSGSYKAK